MRFLADESCDFAVVRALRTGGQLASLVQETFQRLGDRLTGSFVVLEPNRVRIGRSPGR